MFSDSCFDSFESLKLQTFGCEDILDYGCSRRESCGKSKENDGQDNVDENDVCYPSLANLPEVCVHSSSMSKSSKQGEGDFQHSTIKEAVAFYRLETGKEENRPGGSKDYMSCCGTSSFVENVQKDAELFDTIQTKYSLETEEEGHGLNGSSKECNNSCASSVTSETSHNELIEDLVRNINNVSFDNIQLSDSDDASVAPQVSSGANTPVNWCSREVDGCVCLFDDQGNEGKGAYDCSEQSCLHQSKKFCQVNNVNFFPHNTIPSNYCQLVNESYKYDSIAKDESEQILSVSDGSSEELVIIESDEVDQITADNCCYPFLCSVTPSTMCLSQMPGTSYQSAEPHENRITVVADVEPGRNWEEALEIQVNVTEPTNSTELKDDEDCEVFKTRRYWTSVGLVTEKNVNPKYATLLSDDAGGIESAPGVQRVQETRFTRDLQGEDEILTFDEVTERDTNQKLRQNFGRYGKMRCELPKQEHGGVYTDNDVELGQSGESESGDNKYNYLNISEETARYGKKKNKFVSRLTKSLTNLFRSKKKNPK